MNDDRDAVEALAEEFAERYRRGERPAIADYQSRCPERGDEIRELFATLMVMEQLKPDSLPSDKCPERLGEFRIVRELGRGGMGIVFEAVQEPLKRRVALKVLNYAALLNPQTIERFRREARAAAQLHHTNIVPVFGVGEASGRHFYAMQYIDGHGLDSILRDVKRLRADPAATSTTMVGHALTSKDHVESTSHGSSGFSITDRSRYVRSCAQVGLQVADALAHAHQRGILHRDIKPSNLLMDMHGNTWITDFGLAKTEDGGDLTNSGDAVGTVRFMAPERFAGQSSPQSDIYSLGVTLYEMVTLAPIFEAVDRVHLLDKIRHDVPRPPRQCDPAIPRDLETIILKCIAREPRDRYRSALEMADDLRRFLHDRPIQARRVTGWEQASRWAKRNPALASVGAAAFLFLGVGLTLTYFQWRRAEANAEQALRQADRAEKSFQWAHGAIEALLADFSDLTHAREPSQIKAAQQRMLQHAIELQEQYRAVAPPTPPQRQELAKAAFLNATFRQAQGDIPGMEHALRQVFELVDQSPTDTHPELVTIAGRAHCLAASLCKGQKRYRDAHIEIQKGIELLESAARVNPGDHSLQYSLAAALTTAAELAVVDRQWADAQLKFAAAHHRISQLARNRDLSEHHSCQMRFLMAQNDILWAALHYTMRQPTEELVCYRRAARIADELLELKPADALFRKLGAQAHVGVADALRRAGDAVGSRPAYHTAAAHSRWLVDQFPHEADYRAMHARALNNMVNVIEPSKVGEALLKTEEASRHAWFAVTTRTDVVLYRSYLNACVKSFAKAAKRTDDVATVKRLAESILHGPAMGAGEEAFIAAMLLGQFENLHPRSLEALRLAVERGFRDSERLTRAMELASLRDHSDYPGILELIKSQPD